MSRTSVQRNTQEIPYLLKDEQIRENLLKLTRALKCGISYEFISQLVPPTLLCQLSGTYHFPIQLTLQEADELGRGRDNSYRGDGVEQGHYNSKVLIRVCKIDKGVAQLDCIPPKMTVRVNDVFYKMESQEGPIDITPHLKVNPGMCNLVIIDQTAPVGLFVVSIILVKALNCSALVKNLMRYRLKPEIFTKEKILRFHKLMGPEVSLTSTEFSLMCPLSRKKFVIPAQGEDCNHLGCFDLQVYLKLNTTSGKWLCPFCNKKVLLRQLVVDEYWNKVIAQLAQDGNDTDTVILNIEGGWTPKSNDDKIEDISETITDPVVVKQEPDIRSIIVDAIVGAMEATQAMPRTLLES